MADPAETIDALRARVRDQQCLIDEQQREIERLTVGTMLLLTDHVRDIGEQLASLQRRMSALDGAPFREPRPMLDH
jgi:hypothetical protein